MGKVYPTRGGQFQVPGLLPRVPRMDAMPLTWTVTARNLADHSNNAIHTDEGARAEGFPSALVAGVTTYAYLTHPLVAAWGAEWVEHGGGEVRFRAPVFAARSIDCVPNSNEDGSVAVVAVDPAEERNPRAVLTANRRGAPPPASRSGDVLAPREYVLDGYYGPDYGARAGDDIGLYRHDDVVHPAVWPAIANNIVHTELATGSWIHTRSRINHHGLAHRGDVVAVEAVVVERFVRSGTRVVVDVVIERAGTPIATLEHEAIVDIAVS